MAQIDTLQTYHKNKMIKLSRSLAVVVPLATSVDILEVTNLEMMTRFGFSVLPTTNAFDVCTISVKFHPDGPYVAIATIATDYTSPTGLMIKASASLVTLAAGTTGWALVDITPCSALKITASAGVGAATADVYSAAM